MQHQGQEVILEIEWIIDKEKHLNVIRATIKDITTADFGGVIFYRIYYFIFGMMREPDIK